MREVYTVFNKKVINFYIKWKTGCYNILPSTRTPMFICCLQGIVHFIKKGKKYWYSWWWSWTKSLTGVNQKRAAKVAAAGGNLPYLQRCIDCHIRDIRCTLYIAIRIEWSSVFWYLFSTIVLIVAKKILHWCCNHLR